MLEGVIERLSLIVEYAVTGLLLYRLAHQGLVASMRPVPNPVLVAPPVQRSALIELLADSY